MKKCITILLTILLFINSGGFIVIFYQVQKSAKEEMLVSIKTGNYKIREVVQFIINKEQYNKNINGFIWKDRNEFEYKEELYDIINISAKNDSLVLSCLNDFTEEQIVKTFNNEVNSLASGKINNSKIKTSLINLISQALLKNTFEFPRTSDEQKFYITSDDNTLLNEREIPTPPPKLI